MKYPVVTKKTSSITVRQTAMIKMEAKIGFSNIPDPEVHLLL